MEKNLKQYARGIIGGLLFSLPMLYTMEFWWAGFLVTPLRLILYFLVGMSLLLIYNHYVGIRKAHSLPEGLSESIEEMGLGIILSAFVLWVTGRIAPGMSLSEISGKIIVEAVTVAIGISVGKSQLGSNGGDEDVESQDPVFIRSIGVGLCGALLIASNVAPTEEVIVIALEISPFKLLVIALISMIIGGIVLYYSNFRGAKRRVIEPESSIDILGGVVIMYAIALSSSAFMLWFFGRFNGFSLHGVVAETVVLAFPSALGASAGRLLIQP